MNVSQTELLRIRSQDLDEIAPYLDKATVDDLSFRLMGFSDKPLETECLRLADAMLEDMGASGRHVGPVDHVVVVALLRAAVARSRSWQRGHA